MAHPLVAAGIHDHSSFAEDPSHGSAQEAYALVVGPPTEEFRSRYVAESIRFGRLFDLAAESWPDDRPGFRRYFRTTPADDLAVGEAARAVASQIPDVRCCGALRVAGPLVSAVTARLLPDRVAAMYGLRTCSSSATLTSAVTRTARSALPLPPRFWPPEAIASKRLGAGPR